MSETEIFEEAVRSSGKLRRGKVWCKKCQRTQAVDSARCLHVGWHAAAKP